MLHTSQAAWTTSVAPSTSSTSATAAGVGAAAPAAANGMQPWLTGRILAPRPVLKPASRDHAAAGGLAVPTRAAVVELEPRDFEDDATWAFTEFSQRVPLSDWEHTLADTARQPGGALQITGAWCLV